MSGIKPTSFNKAGSEKELTDGYQRQMAAIKGRGKPLGGAPPVKIPPLNADPITGPNGEPLTMEQQAEVLRDPRSPLSPFYNPTLAEAGDLMEHQSMDPQQLRSMRVNPNTMARVQGEPMQKRTGGPFGGTLPPEAAKDPNFRPGVGSMYAANQPGVRAGNEQEKPKLSPETVEGLDALQKFNADAQATQEANLKQAEQENEKSYTDRLAEEIGIESSLLAQLRQERNSLDSLELREAIEKRCSPISIEQMLDNGEIRQTVPIVRDKFVVEFRTVTGEEDLAIKRELYVEKQVPDIYLFDKLNIMQLTAAIYSINGRPLPDHLNERRRFDRTKFFEKFDRVISMPMAWLASVSINFSWFDARTRRLFSDLGELKNG